LSARNLLVNGRLSSNGGQARLSDGSIGDGGGGSGGSLLVELNGGSFNGTGTLEARGGQSRNPAHVGGGGRIAILDFNENNFTGSFANAGTVYVQPLDGLGRLYSDSSIITIPANTTNHFVSIHTGSTGISQIQNDGVLQLSEDSLNGSINLQNNGTLIIDSDHLTIHTNVVLVQDGIVKGGNRASNWIGGVTIEGGGVVTHGTERLAGAQLNVVGLLEVLTAGSIDVTSKGYLGGSQPGNPDGARPHFPGADGAPLAGDYTGGGSFGNSLSQNTNPSYGSETAPVDLGSGGSALTECCGSAGGNGGGRIYLRAQNLRIDGDLLANGGQASLSGNALGDGGAGSGGSIFVKLSGGSFRGKGRIVARGGQSRHLERLGGGGRVAVMGYSENSFSGELSDAGAVFTQQSGKAGSLLLNQAVLAIAADTTRRFDEINASNNGWSYIYNNGSLALDSDRFIIGKNLRFFQDGVIKGSDRDGNWIGSATIAEGGYLTHSQGKTSGAELNVVGMLTVESGGWIDADAKGYLGGFKPGNFDPSGRAQTRGPDGIPIAGDFSGGGSYGTLSPSDTNPLYGSESAPIDLGTGGSATTQCCGASGGNGGGRIHIRAESVRLDGMLTANGGAALNGPSDLGAGGGGSGGSIFLELAGGKFSGVGSIEAYGGSSSSVLRTGGCGRIAIVGHSLNDFHGTLSSTCDAGVYLTDSMTTMVITPTKSGLGFDWSGPHYRLESRSGFSPGTDWLPAAEIITVRGGKSSAETFPTGTDRFWRLVHVP
jgi:hypothetical protein